MHARTRTKKYIPRHYIKSTKYTVPSTNLLTLQRPIVRHVRKRNIALHTYVQLILASVASLFLLTSSITG